MTTPESAIDRLAECLWLQHGMSEQAANTKAQTLIDDAVATIASAGGKIVWEEV